MLDQILHWKPLTNVDTISIQHALQSHPESFQLWDKYITKILVENFEFKTCKHEPYLYYKADKANSLTLITIQVDDFLIYHKNPHKCDQLATELQKNWRFINFFGTIQKLNSDDVDQTQYYNHIHCSTYID